MMKLSLLLSAATSIAAAFVLPDEHALADWFKAGSHHSLQAEQHVTIPGHVFENIDSITEITTPWGDSLDWLSNNDKRLEELVSKLGQEWNREPSQEAEALDCPHHSMETGFTTKSESQEDKEPPSQTIYQLISNNKHTKIFAHAISKFDDVVDYLNSKNANITVFVPVDSAFRKPKKHPHLEDKIDIPKEDILRWIHYHISPKLYPKHAFLSVQTVPTLLKLGKSHDNPQRISTQLGFRGLVLNFYAHIIKPDIFASNGVIHAINAFLIPPFPALDTIDILPSVLSTFHLGLLKTGLVDVSSRSLPAPGTAFLPTNLAFRKLGLKINAFLFSKFGDKYLKALLEYHLVANHTLYSDAYYEGKGEVSGEGHHHIDLPTLLADRHLAIDIHNIHRLVTIMINKSVRVAVPNIPVNDGVIHLLPGVIIPPKKPGKHENSQVDRSSDLLDHESMITLDELIERLEPYVGI